MIFILIDQNGCAQNMKMCQESAAQMRKARERLGDGSRKRGKAGTAPAEHCAHARAQETPLQGITHTPKA